MEIRNFKLGADLGVLFDVVDSLSAILSNKVDPHRKTGDQKPVFFSVL